MKVGMKRGKLLLLLCIIVMIAASLTTSCSSGMKFFKGEGIVRKHQLSSEEEEIASLLKSMNHQAFLEIYAPAKTKEFSMTADYYFDGELTHQEKLFKADIIPQKRQLLAFVFNGRTLNIGGGTSSIEANLSLDKLNTESGMSGMSSVEEKLNIKQGEDFPLIAVFISNDGIRTVQPETIFNDKEYIKELKGYVVLVKGVCE